MAKVIGFYVPSSFSKKAPYAARSRRGKVIELPSPEGIQTGSDSAEWQGIWYMCGWSSFRPARPVQNAYVESFNGK
jgi:hypothetical protein